jgi:hypothetical protein
MPSFRTGVVVRLLEGRRGLQRVEVDLGDGPERAYALTQLTGPVAVGDRVVLNTTAVELGLGTGGWHVVHWNLAREEWREPGPGHVLKVRYTSLQADVGSTEEHLAGPEHVVGPAKRPDVDGLGGMPVVAAGLHSHLPAIAAAFKEAAPQARLVYVMTDGAGLPLALSDLVAALTARGLLDATITCGQAFGGDYEAVSVHSALTIARHVARADAVVVAMGPGVAGTGTRLGFSAIEVGPVLDAAEAIGGRPVACLRVSAADPRPRHQGLSHHSATALGLACRSRVTIPFPLVGGAEEDRLRADLVAAGLDGRHDVVAVKPPDILALFDRHGLAVTSMGRPAAADPVFFASAAAAGTLAAELVFPLDPGAG